jgi:hypothetical protein
MIAYEILVNGHRVCTAGASGVLDATVVWTPGPGSHPRLMVGGMDKGESEHLNWPSMTLGIGDEVTIRIVSTDNIDPPIRKPPA